jgi:hypothetical protein
VLRNTVAIVFHFAGSVKDYHDLCNDPVRFNALLVAIRPERCPHCGDQHTCIFWGSYLRWVYLSDDRCQVRIERVCCVMCGVTHSLLPSFLHLFRRYTLTLIQQAIILALETGVWGDRLADAVAPYHQPALATLHEWVRSFLHGVERLLAWLQHSLVILAPLVTLDAGCLPAYLPHLRSASRRSAFSQGWQFLRLAETFYATCRADQPDLTFQFDALFAFLVAALQTAGKVPRLLWRKPPARAPT